MASTDGTTTPPELLAFDALAKVARLSDLVAVVKGVVSPAAEARRADWVDPERVRALAGELGLADADAETPLGNALTVLERGPEGEQERALARAMFAHVVAEHGEKDGEDRLAGDVLWLAAMTPFDCTLLLDRALGDRAPDLLRAMADRVKAIDARPTHGRAEAIVGVAALASSPSAREILADLGGKLADPTLRRLAIASAPPAEDREHRLEGEMVPAPRSPWATAVLALSGLLFVLAGARLLFRLALGLRSPAEILVKGDKIRIRARTTVLGRTVREREIVFGTGGIVRATREVRYPRAAFYAGLVALAVGSVVGVSLFVDGVRAASPSLLVWGLLVVGLGVAADFAMSSLVPGAVGECRIAFAPASGRTVCVGGVDIARADEVLARVR
jgi:hypothetical protein